MFLGCFVPPDIKLKPVMHDFVAHFSSDLGLQPLDPVVDEFDDLASLHVNHMVMMALIRRLPPRRFALKFQLFNNTLGLQCRQCAVNSGQ